MWRCGWIQSLKEHCQELVPFHVWAPLFLDLAFISSRSFPIDRPGCSQQLQTNVLSASSLNRKRASFPNNSGESPRINSDWPGLNHIPVSELIPTAMNVGLSLSKLTQPHRLRAVLWSLSAAPSSDTKALALRVFGWEVMVAGIKDGGRDLEFNGLGWSLTVCP